MILVLIVGLALLTWAASGVVETTVREWFERDVTSRAHLVLTTASHSLANIWDNSTELDAQLAAIAHDERVIAVAACNTDLSLRSSTTGFPQEFGCLEVGPRVSAAYPAKGQPEEPFHDWSTVATVPTGRVQVSAMPISSAGQELGFVTLVQDLSYIDRREARARTFLIIISGILAVTAFGVPLIVAKRARHDWGSNCVLCCVAAGSKAGNFSLS